MMSDIETFDAATQHAIELLSPLGPIVAKRLFGTWGLYLEDHIFGLVHEGVVYFRTDNATVERYAAAGSSPFLYRCTDGRDTAMQYHEVPQDVLADGDVACAWAYEAAASKP